MNLQVAGFELARAHATAVATFARYPLRGSVAGCPCCVSTADHAELMRGDLRRYAFKAMTTWGDEVDFKHFLPVLLAELTPDADAGSGHTVHGGACDLQRLAGKLAYAHWHDWPQAEQRAVIACLQAWWLNCLRRQQQAFTAFLSGHSPQGWDESVIVAYDDIRASGLLPEAWLQQAWQEAALPAAAQLPADYVQSPAFLTLVARLFTLYYAHGILPPGDYQNLTVQQYLEAGFFAYAERAPKLAHRISGLLQHLEHPPGYPIPALVSLR